MAKRENLSLTVECQLTNVVELMDLESHRLAVIETIYLWKNNQ